MAITLKELEITLNNTETTSKTNKIVVSKPYIVETKISIIPNKAIDKLFKSDETVTEISLIYNEKTKKLIKISTKTTKDTILILRIHDGENYYRKLGWGAPSHVTEFIKYVNNEFSHNTVLTVKEIYSRSERFYIIAVRNYTKKLKPVGIIALYINGSQSHRKGEISRFAVIPTERNKKYGQKTVKRAINLSQSNGLNPFVWIREDNEIMQHIAEKLKFESTDRKRHNKRTNKTFFKWVYKGGTVTVPQKNLESEFIRETVSSPRVDGCDCEECTRARNRANTRTRRRTVRSPVSPQKDSVEDTITDNTEPESTETETHQDRVNRVLSGIPDLRNQSRTTLYFNHFDSHMSVNEFVECHRVYLNEHSENTETENTDTQPEIPHTEPESALDTVLGRRARTQTPESPEPETHQNRVNRVLNSITNLQDIPTLELYNTHFSNHMSVNEFARAFQVFLDST